MADDKEFKTFTGTIEGIGSRREAGKGPRKVEIKAKPNDQYNKTFRVWEHAYDEEAEGPGTEKAEVFEYLEKAYEDGTRVTVQFFERPYDVTVKGKKEARTQNLITDAWDAAEDTPAGEGEVESSDKEASEKPAEGGKTPSGRNVEMLKKDAEMVADALVARLKKEGLIIGPASALQKDGEPEGLDAEVYEDFLKQAGEDDIGEKAISKKFEKLFPGKDWREGSIEELTAVAEALDFTWQ